MALAIIPARGGSKRIPKKNIRLFHGKPMLAYAIETALQSQCFQQIIVSTDDEEIAQTARTYGAQVPFMRPASLADDMQGTMAVILHALQWLQERQTLTALTCCLYPTCPLLQPEDLIKAKTQLQQHGNWQYVLTGGRYPHPIQRAFAQTDAGGIIALDAQAMGARSQDLSPRFHDAGQFYFGRTQAFLNQMEMFANHTYLLTLPADRICDIDTPEDWQRAEFLYTYRQQMYS